VAGLGNPDRPVGGLAVRTPPGVELVPLGRDALDAAVDLTRAGRGLAPIADATSLRGRWEALINSPDSVGFLAVADGTPSGLGLMVLRRRLNYATFEGWISELHAPAGADGMEMAAILVQALVAEWRLRGGHRVMGSVPDGDETRRVAVQAAGFEQGLIDFQLRPVVVADDAPPPGLQLRPLTASDADAVTRLIAEFGPRRSPVPDRMDAVLRSFAAHQRDVEAGRAVSIVAELEGMAVGVCTLEWQRPFWSDELHAWIPDLVVTEPVRGRGFGRALLAGALRAARDAGATEVRLESGAQRAAAHGLYRSTGFVAIGHTWMLRREV
jgi:GNAT superfamily N-acetyltransferase